MRKPVAVMLPAIECMPFAHFYPVVWEDQADAAPEAAAASDEAPADQGHGFWERVLEALASVAWPYGYTGI